MPSAPRGDAHRLGEAERNAGSQSPWASQGLPVTPVTRLHGAYEPVSLRVLQDDAAALARIAGIAA